MTSNFYYPGTTIPFYPKGADYTTNAASFADYLARHEELMKYLSHRVWEYDKALAERLAAWDKNLEEFDAEVIRLLQEWITDGTFADIINEEIFADLNDKIDLKVNTDDLPYINVKALKDRLGSTYDLAFQIALDTAKTKGGVHLIFPAGERVELMTEHKVYSNTTIEAEPGVEFYRNHAGYMLMTGNRTTEPNPSNFLGYTGYGNITIKGGTWNANGVALGGKASIWHFSHGDGFFISETTLLDCASSHHIEFNACRNIHCTRVSFKGLAGGTSLATEALQLDVARKGTTFIGSDDGTPCKDVWVTDCYFGPSNTPGSGNIARGIGSHTTVADSIQTNINISGCTFDNCLSFAIRALNYAQVTIRGNTFLNCGAGINIRSAMTGEGTENKVGIQIGAQEIRDFVISDNLFEGWRGSGRLIEVYGERDTAGWVRGVTVSGNTINMNGSETITDAICFVVTENVACTGNSIINAKASAIAMNTANSVAITGNDITNSRDDAIQALDCNYTIITGNTILKAGSNGVYFSESEGIVISSNIISGVNGLGVTIDPKNHIRLVTTCMRGTIIGNVLRNFSTTHVTPNAIQTTSTCLDIIAKDNVGVNLSFDQFNPTNRPVDANGNMS